MTEDMKKRRRMARRFLEDPVPPRTHRNSGKSGPDRRREHDHGRH